LRLVLGGLLGRCRKIGRVERVMLRALVTLGKVVRLRMMVVEEEEERAVMGICAPRRRSLSELLSMLMSPLVLEEEVYGEQKLEWRADSDRSLAVGGRPMTTIRKSCMTRHARASNAACGA